MPNNSVLRKVAIRLLVHHFRDRLKTAKDTKGSLDFAFSFRGMGFSIEPWQIREEMEHLMRFVARMKPRVILEIGSAGGGTIFLFTRIAHPQALLISLDIPYRRHIGGYPLWRVPIYREFTQAKQKLHFVRSDSHMPRTLKSVKRILRGRKIDFLFIDADHTYEGVARDFNMYAPLVKEGGVVAFHDIVHGTKSGEVHKFWKEIRGLHPHLEFVKNYNQGSDGIGLLVMSDPTEVSNLRRTVNMHINSLTQSSHCSFRLHDKSSSK
jgi:cephalosporin hydroxylase